MARKIMSTGVGQSKQFGAGEKFEANPVQHAGGRPVGTGPLDHLLASQHTDESLAESAKRPKAQTKVVRDATDKRIGEQYLEDRIAAKPWMDTNPMQQIAAKHCPPGHAPRFLGARKVEIDGLRGWEPVIGPNGDPIKLGNMTLASMPKDEANERNNHFRQLDKDKISAIRDETVEQTSRLAKAKGMTLAAGEAGFKRTHGNAAALED
jgi:hypothetical protein